MKSQPQDCIRRFPLRTAAQLPALLQAFRKEVGLTQREVALRLGVTPWNAARTPGCSGYG